MKMTAFGRSVMGSGWSLATRLALLATVAAAAGCGGGGGTASAVPFTAHVPSGSVPSPTAAIPSTTAANLTITIPTATGASARQRHALYVSSATNSATFTPSGGATTVIPLTATSPNCSTTSNGRSCAIVVSTASGSAVSFAISTFASTDGTGSPLSTVHATQAIVANQANAINVTLGAVVSQVQVSLSNAAFTVGQAGTASVGVNVLDAANRIIAVGPNNLVDANDNPVTVTLSDSDSTASSLSSTTLGSAPITLTYNGQTPSGSGATITATASSLTSASVASGNTPFLFQAASPIANAPAGTIVTTSANACINHTLYTNDVLPAGVGEFGTNGLDRSYWGGVKTRTVGQFAGTWGPSFAPSWGRHQYDTYFADPSDGLGLDPFTVAPDTGAPGSPQGLRIMAAPLPTNIARSLTVMSNDQWTVTSASTSFQVPSEGGSLVVSVANPNAAQNGWNVGIGYQGGAITFIGKLMSGGATPSGNGTGGANPWTISNIHIYSGTAGTTITPGVNDEGGFRAYGFPDYYSGALDTNINLQYGYFTARVRLPNYLPALSPAFWTLETGGVATGPNGLERDELDIEEMFGSTSGNSLNAGEIEWGTDSWPKPTGVYNFPNGNPQSDYHDYGVLLTPGSTTYYLDGQPLAGHSGGPDWTQNSPDKEIMLMFQIGAPGSWLDPGAQGMNNAWPQYYWAQWMRIYQPSTTPC